MSVILLKTRPEIRKARDVGRGQRPQRMVKPLIYFAGRMQGCKHCNDWRDAIAGFARLYDTGERFGDAEGRIDEDIIDCKSFFYSGPFVIEGAGGHNAGHTDFTEAHRMIWDIDKSQIERADLIFAYLEDTQAYGTLVEIGYAVALGKPVVIGFSDAMRREDYDELWLARMAVAKVYVGPPGAVWQQICTDWISEPRPHHS